jgi:uncharacterized protein (DUF849 family)
MNDAVFITCAVTGSGDSAGKSPHVPVTPAKIAESALEAHRAGAAIVHLHVRDPNTGKASRDPALFRELYDRIRQQNTDVILNLTGGMGGDLIFGSHDRPLDFAAGTDFVGPLERITHVLALRPELGTIDCGSLNFDESLYGTTPSFLAQMLRAYREKGVRPEVEVFELGHIELAKELMKQGLLDSKALFQLCLGIRFGAPATPDSMLAMRRALPPDVTWSAFGVGRMQMPMVAQTVLLGGNPRVGLEDNLYLDKGVFATNGQLVERAVRIVQSLGSRVLSASETRSRLGFLRPN